MKVNIVTVYNSLNPGSFLQATSLYHALEEMHYDVSFYDAGIRNLWKQALIESLYLCKNRNFSKIGEKFKLARLYAEELKNYHITKTVDKEQDVFVLGSDEIWNVARENMAQYPILWGKGLNYQQTFSYAPSLNNATEDDLKKYEYVQEALEQLHAISVRDKYSCDTLSKVTGKNVTEVCDPTVLVFPKAYQQIENRCITSNYILIYIYKGSVSDEDIEAIKKFAKKENKKLVAFGATQKWCDINVNGSPHDFLMYIKYADYVCTSTFHGTMLSMIMNRQFAVLGEKNRKVQELMDSVHLERHATGETLETVLKTAYDCAQVNKRLTEMKQNGLEFLKTSIENIG